MDKAKITRYSIFFVIVAVLVGLFIWHQATPGKYDKLALCLKDSGTKFYGAFWCPHCQATKQMFGKSAKKLPYVECSAPDGQSQLQVCKDQKIDGYPTWIFPDGTRLSGELTIDALAAKTNCSVE
jgi:thiol-disulfide isomerase/thioredoxin